MKYDALVIGAGFAGAVAARQLAEQGNMQVLVLERRDHIGGNAFDCKDEAGVLIHRYGPHIFHTADQKVYEYLSQFTNWLDYQHRVVANVHGQLMPVPFNLESLEIAFGDRAAALEGKLLDAYGPEQKVTILELRKNQDPELAELADYVYQNVFVYYTMKQWGTTPEQIDPATTARVPVFLSRDDRYFQDPYQGMPANGYTSLFARMLDHPNITVELEQDARKRLLFAPEGIKLDGAAFDGPVIYTGQVDELFDCRYGQLPYRSLDFQFETHPVDWYQTRGTVNYTVDQPYTRITEFKHMTAQELRGVTTTVKEFSRAYTGNPGDTPYYAIINPENVALYDKYKALADAMPNLHLVGRLAEYKYYNMDAIVAQAANLVQRLLQQ